MGKLINSVFGVAKKTVKKIKGGGKKRRRKGVKK